MRATPTATISEARARLTKIVASFREGQDAEPVVFGDRRTPEAVVIPYALYELLQDVAEELVIAAQVQERRAADTGVRHSFEDVAARFGIDPDDL